MPDPSPPMKSKMTVTVEQRRVTAACVKHKVYVDSCVWCRCATNSMSACSMRVKVSGAS